MIDFVMTLRPARLMIGKEWAVNEALAYFENERQIRNHMSVTGKDTSRIIRRMIKYLDTLRSGTEISIMGIFMKACSPEIDNWKFKIGDCIFDEVLMPDGKKQDFLFELAFRFIRAAERHGYILDTSKYDGMPVGLPYNIPIVFRRPRRMKKQKTH